MVRYIELQLPNSFTNHQLTVNYVCMYVCRYIQAAIAIAFVLKIVEAMK